MTAVAAAFLTAAMPYLIAVACTLIMSGATWAFAKGLPALIGKMHAGHLRDWLSLLDQTAGNVVLGLLQPALDAAGKETTPEAAAKAALAVLMAGVQARLGPGGMQKLAGAYGADATVLLQHLLVSSANNPPETADATQLKKADELAAHLNVLTA